MMHKASKSLKGKITALTHSHMTAGRACAITVAFMIVFGISLDGCASNRDIDAVTPEYAVDNFEQLDLPTADADINVMLQSSQGVPIVKVSGQWMWYYAFGDKGIKNIVVNTRVNGITCQQTLKCRFGLPVAIMNDVQSDDEAYITYGDDATYAYVIHIPAE